MFDLQPPKEERRTDYTGPIIVAMLAPVFVLFAAFDKADMGLAACIVLGMAMVAIRFRWSLRRHIWFWAIILALLVLHIPLLFLVRWPQSNGPTILYTMPVGVADFILFSGAIALGEQLFVRRGSETDE